MFYETVKISLTTKKFNLPSTKNSGVHFNFSIFMPFRTCDLSDFAEFICTNSLILSKVAD